MGEVGVRWPRKKHRCNIGLSNPHALSSEVLGCGSRGAGPAGGGSAPGTVGVGDWLGAHLAGDSTVVCAALPEAPAVACDASNQLVLIGEVHLPD